MYQFIDKGKSYEDWAKSSTPPEYRSKVKQYDEDTLNL